MLGSQVLSPGQLADPSLCGGGDPWKRPCTTQVTWIDRNRGKCPSGALGGHANWGLATYEGRIFWDNHSHYLQDDDYNFNLHRDDLAGLPHVNVSRQEYLHMEFNSDETIDAFDTWYWKDLHQAVDEDAGWAGVMSGLSKPAYTKTRPLVDGKEAIVMGLYGLDAAHAPDRSCTGDCGAELHPVYAMAIHVNDNLEDDQWAIFVRNWGDEGYCSSGQERIEPTQPFVFSFRFKRPGALTVESTPATSSDPAGQFGTTFRGDSDNGANGLAWSGPSLIPNEGAVVTFYLPPSSQGGWINGMLHLKWTVSSKPNPTMFRKMPNSLASSLTVLRRLGESAEVEANTSRLIERLTPPQMETLERSWHSPRRQPTTIPRISPRGVGPRRGVVTRVTPVQDSARERREQQLQATLRTLSPPD
jgi:hypothetical protein